MNVTNILAMVNGSIFHNTVIPKGWHGVQKLSKDVAYHRMLCVFWVVKWQHTLNLLNDGTTHYLLRKYISKKKKKKIRKQLLPPICLIIHVTIVKG